jgi:tripartite-type tricarboxylate transporter receptor subunit TctC
VNFKFIFSVLLFLFSSISHAWEPTKPVSVVIAYGPGSGNEMLFRKIDSIVSSKYKNLKFVLEFKPGANELIGMNHFSQASNDGHTIYVPGVGVWFGTPVWYKKTLLQDPTEWEPIVSLGEAPLAFYVSPGSKINTPGDLAQSLKNGDKVNVGVGAPVQVLAYEFMAKQTSATNSQRVQFNSPAAVAQAVAGNQIEVGIGPLPVVAELAKAGKVRVIGVTGNNKSVFPNVADTFKGLDLVGHVGIVLPKNTPKDIVDFYKDLFTETVNSNEYQEFLKDTGWFDSIRNSNNYKSFIVNQRKKWIPVAETVQFN